MFILTLFDWYISLPIIGGLYYIAYVPIMMGYLLNKNHALPVNQTPFMAAIPIATLFFGIIDWVRWLPCMDYLNSL